MFGLIRTLLITALVFSAIGCASTDTLDTKTADGLFALAQKYEKDERFEEAITNYSDVKNKFPYSRYAIESELSIANIEFQRENFVESENAYKLFKEFHPNYEKIPYVTFQIGLSIYNQLPKSIDRDLTIAKSAIEQFDSVITNYPKSEFVAKSIEFRDLTKKMLAEKSYYIAQFYFIREFWLSALGRYEEVLRSHPSLGYDTKALYGATISAYKLKDNDKAKLYFKKLLSEYPNSKELAKARKEMADGF